MKLHSLRDCLETDGFCVLRGVFDAASIMKFRETTLNNLGEMGQTRNVGHSYHLAGFHRFPCFSDIHTQMLQSRMINDFLHDFFAGDRYMAIGLSDITINRSQHWHTDLLRGEYAKYLENVDPWAHSRGPCIKALAYLQPGKSLRIVRGSHLSSSPLNDAELEELAHSQNVEQLEINAGDVVMMDIRALHRGSTDDEMNNPALASDPKVLLSSVFGRTSSAFSRAMQIGNAHRMAAWDEKFLSH